MSRATATRVALRVDPVACDAYGFCAELLPERITLDEWGYPVVDGRVAPFVEGDPFGQELGAVAEGVTGHRVDPQ